MVCAHLRPAEPAMRAPELEESLRSEPIIDLVSNLHSPDDTVRQASEQTLQKGYRVSKIGAGPVLELMEAMVLNLRSESDPQAGYIGTVLEGAAGNLIHDDPELVADFSDASFQRAFMYISGPYPMKALHTQGVRIPISSSVGICSVEIPSPGASAMAPAQWLAGLPLEKGENLC
jgi:hypothetical protein